MNEGVGTVPGYTTRKDDLDARLARVECQIRGLRKMVQEDAHCIDVLCQVGLATSGLHTVGLGLLDNHIWHCVRESLSTDDGGDRIAELVSAVDDLITR